jgi:hypothetical protein
LGVALALSELPLELSDRHTLGRRIHVGMDKDGPGRTAIIFGADEIEADA